MADLTKAPLLAALERFRRTGETPWEAVRRVTVEEALVACEYRQNEAAELLGVSSRVMNRMIWGDEHCPGIIDPEEVPSWVEWAHRDPRKNKGGRRPGARDRALGVEG